MELRIEIEWDASPTPRHRPTYAKLVQKAMALGAEERGRQYCAIRHGEQRPEDELYSRDDCKDRNGIEGQE